MLLFAYLYEHEDAKETKNRVEQLGRRCDLPYLRSAVQSSIQHLVLLLEETNT